MTSDTASIGIYGIMACAALWNAARITDYQGSVALVDRSSEAEAGGNSSWSPTKASKG